MLLLTNVACARFNYADNLTGTRSSGRHVLAAVGSPVALSLTLLFINEGSFQLQRKPGIIHSISCSPSLVNHTQIKTKSVTEHQFWEPPKLIQKESTIWDCDVRACCIDTFDRAKVSWLCIRRGIQREDDYSVPRDPKTKENAMSFTTEPAQEGEWVRRTQEKEGERKREGEREDKKEGDGGQKQKKMRVDDWKNVN